MVRRSNAETARLLSERIKRQVERAAGKGMAAVKLFLLARIKETLNVPAPKVRKVTGPNAYIPGVYYWRATTAAVPFAPPRKITGNLQRSLTGLVRDAVGGLKGGKELVIGANARGMLSAAYPTGFQYPKYHEEKGWKPKSGRHQFIEPTVEKFRNELRKIVGRSVKGEVV